MNSEKSSPGGSVRGQGDQGLREIGGRQRGAVVLGQPSTHRHYGARPVEL